MKNLNIYFVVTTDNNINVYDDETHELRSTADLKFDINDGDFWTGLTINGDKYDINIFNGDCEFPPYSLHLYRLRKDDEGNYIAEWDDYITFGLEFETGYEFDEKFNTSEVSFIKL